jgi:amidase
MQPRTVSSTELTSLSAAELAGLVKARSVSSAEVVDAHLRRIEEINPLLNAVVQVDGARALRAAAAADAAVARGDPLGPLHGIPFTAKDNLETAGVITAVGVPERADCIPTRDATVIARLRSAGAILIGKTNCPPWGAGSVTDNSLYGRTNNPYDVERTPGGSSGGEAATIASGGSPCGLGSDSGGSLRQPAHFCGIACLKPTAGLVPLTGMVHSDGAVGAISDPRTQVGPMARFVGDLALVLQAIAGAGPLEPDVPPVRMADPAAVVLRGLRAAVHTENEAAAPTPDTRAAVEAAAEALSHAGAQADELRLPAGGHELTREVWASYSGRMRSDELYRVLRRWDGYRRRMLEFMQPYDLILCPVFPCAAVRHDETDSEGLWEGVGYTTPFSLTGWPAAVVRCGSSTEGLPIGVQVVARPWCDHVALAAAAYLETELGGWSPPQLSRLRFE